MKFIKAAFRFYINSSLHVALAVVSLSVFTFIQFDLSVDYKLLSFIFLSSISGYNFVKYAPVARLHHRSLTQQLKQIQIFSFVVFIGLIINLFFINLNVILICLALGLITLFYAIPIGRKNLREIAFIKVFVIAFIWAVTTYILPFISTSGEWSALPKLFDFHFVERMLWVVLLMIPFEIRDLKYDKPYLKTLVSSFGILPVKIGSVVILVLLSIHKFMAENLDFNWVYITIYFSLSAAILFAKRNQKPNYSSFYVESLPLLWMVLMLI